MQNQSDNIVFYHGNCLDGTASAWVAMHYLPKDTIYLPAFYQAGLEEDIKMVQQCQDRKVWFLDWCPEIEQLDKCEMVAEHVTIIDHHESAIKKLDNHAYTAYNPPKLTLFLAHENEWSGAMGTAIWFHSHNVAGTFDMSWKPEIHNLSLHWLVRAVDDRDRWQFKLPGTRQINEGLGTLTLDPSLWFAIVMDHKMEHHLFEIGEALLLKMYGQVNQIIDACAFYTEGMAICNCPYHLASEVGNQLAAKNRLAILYFIDKTGAYSVSLRSNDKVEGWVNCAELATKLGGGGHANAAGFKTNEDFKFTLAKIKQSIG